MTMTKEQMDEIRVRHEDAKRKRTWLNLNEVDLSLGDIPALLEAVTERDEEIAGLEQAVETRDRMLADMATERDHYKARAEAAERRASALAGVRRVEGNIPQWLGSVSMDRRKEGLIMKYRKKPVVVEAFQYDGDIMNRDGEYYVPDWAKEAYESGVMYYEGAGELYIKTLEGVHRAQVGDYIIQGVKGELYPCKPDIFEMTYEAVNE